MSQKYSGGFITKSPVAPTSSAASGIWTLDQQQQAQKAGTWPSPPIFIEDLFSTYLYTGNGSTQTITNGIDLSGQGGLTWLKRRDAVINHNLFDTARGATKKLYSDLTNAEYTDATSLTSFNSNGFSLGLDSGGNANNGTYVSWTFREQPKFFDVVTYTGNGVAGRQIAHSLGSAPGCIIVKSTSDVVAWQVYHRSTGATDFLVLNTTAATQPSIGPWNNTAPTSSVFTVGDGFGVNNNGSTYVAYLFAHDAGGFPVSGGGSTNGISCGSYTGNGSTSGPVVDLGYEPQFIITKCATQTRQWTTLDTMRGMSYSPSQYLQPNSSAAEGAASSSFITPTATGFQVTSDNYDVNYPSQTFIYIAIRRGPMKTPTVGTSVFAPVTYAGNSAAQTITAGFRVDMELVGCRTGGQGWEQAFADRLRGNGRVLSSASTGAEVDWSANLTNEFQSNTGTNRTDAYLNFSSLTFVDWMFQRAPSFFDEVCYTGNGSASGQTITHNLTVTPELIIVKRRDSVEQWRVYAASQGVSAYAALNSTAAFATDANNPWKTPTSTTFGVGDGTYWTSLNASGGTFVAYLFATCAGVSKVGSYTGTGALLTVACGFTSGARFVLIKRTDSTGDWYTYDSARGITSGNDPYLLLNSTAAEVTGTNYVDTDTTGFKVTAAAPAGLNANGGTYIFLAIA